MGFKILHAKREKSGHGQEKQHVRMMMIYDTTILSVYC